MHRCLFALLMLAGLIVGPASHAQPRGHPVFVEDQGVLVMEAESTASRPGQWTGMTSVEGFTGRGHIEFTGNSPSNGDADSPLVYYFTINTPGAYSLHLRAHKRLAGEPADRCNDAYVRVEGDYRATPDAANENRADATRNILGSDTKCFGGSAEGWGWAETLDLGNHRFRMPRYVFQEGETYAMVISGRSQRFNIDRIVFCHESVNTRDAKNPERQESARAED